MKFSTQFKVIELNRYDMICGMSYLVKNKIKLDFSARKIIVKGRSINFESRKANCNSAAYTADGIQNVKNLITAKQLTVFKTFE